MRLYGMALAGPDLEGKGPNRVPHERTIKRWVVGRVDFGLNIPRHSHCFVDMTKGTE